MIIRLCRGVHLPAPDDGSLPEDWNYGNYGRIMENYGKLWGIMGYYGELWKNYGELWRIMVNYGRIWVELWGIMGNYGGIMGELWRIMGNYGVLWRIMEEL